MTVCRFVDVDETCKFSITLKRVTAEPCFILCVRAHLICLPFLVGKIGMQSISDSLSLKQKKEVHVPFLDFDMVLTCGLSFHGFCPRFFLHESSWLSFFMCCRLECDAGMV